MMKHDDIRKKYGIPISIYQPDIGGYVKLLNEKGYMNDEIADILLISLRTVQRHVKFYKLEPNVINYVELYELREEVKELKEQIDRLKIQGLVYQERKDW